ncbi:MAG: CAP domain-containing protein [Eudoraea sp.]|uniref:CAP domain-containing protein n=1 Tax=Eudoraea sp. TaxID=1979955 RepID=UPI003C7847B5
MKTRIAFAVSVLFVILAGSCTSESIEDTNNPQAVNIVSLEQELLGIVNSHRKSLGYSDLVVSIVAYEYANSHNDYMITNGSLSHDNFSARASGISSKVNAEMVAENVAKDYSSAKLAFESWLSSPDHRKTMEDDFTHTGISVKKDLNGRLYYTQLFYR